MKVDVDVEETTIENENGREQAGVIVTCTRCDHSVEVFGVTESSIKRGCATLRDECPNSERNFYVDD